MARPIAVRDKTGIVTILSSKTNNWALPPPELLKDGRILVLSHRDPALGYPRNRGGLRYLRRIGRYIYMDGQEVCGIVAMK